MNADRLLALYDRVADAPDAVSRLRCFVLDLAVRGKLVEQDLEDEPASELLKRIAAEKARLVEAGETRTPKPMEVLDEPPFAIPPSWKWTRLGELAELIRGISFPASAKSNEPSDSLLPCLRSGNIQTSTVWDNLIYVPESVVKSANKFVRSGDVLISIANSYALVGKCSIVCTVPYRATFGAFLAAIRFHFVLPEYAKSFLKSDFSSSAFRVGSSQTTNIANITFSTIRRHPFPLPPLSEQYRIVSKVDELMGLCDQLEETRAEREDTRDRLTEASLTRMIAPDTDVPTFRFHARFAVDALPVLTARADQVKNLRQTILNLAVRGKLVEQDPADEPASELLKRIAAEKARMVKAGEIRKPKRMPVLDTDELPFCLPHKWAWTRLFEMSRKIHYGFTASANRMVEAVRLLRITDIQDNRVDWLSVPGCEIEENVLPKFRLEKGDVLIARTGGTVGKSFLVQDVPVTAVFASYLIRIQGSHEVNDRYLKLFLESPTYWTQLRDGARGAGQPNVNGQTLGRIAVPVPPLAEQLRIVTKVDQLMALCDRLEDGLSAVDGTRNGLLESLLHESLGSHEAMINGMIGGVARVGT